MDFGNDRFLVQVNVKKEFVLLGLGSVRHFLKKELVSHTLPISLLTGTAVSGAYTVEDMMIGSVGGPSVLLWAMLRARKNILSRII